MINKCSCKENNLGKTIRGGTYLCQHYNLGALYPNLIEEWSETNNLTIYDYTPGSCKNVKWKCKINPCGCHKWNARIDHRTQKRPTNCPYCSHKILCDHNNLKVVHPELINEWSPKNPPMDQFAPCAHKKAIWICSQEYCGTEWECVIASRTSTEKTNCPGCSNNIVTAFNNLEVVFPNLIKEWDPNNIKLMKEYTWGSTETVMWVCPSNWCGCHKWTSSVTARTCRIRKHDCPYCSNDLLCNHNNLEALYPNLQKEWHPDNKPMNSYSYGSNQHVLWICQENKQHIWQTMIFCRTSKTPTGCPHCDTKGYSKVQIKWLEEIMLKENIIIQHAVSLEGEYKISGVGKVDGYCKETNTVYELHGDFWHGNPFKYNKNDIHPISKKTYGELYKKTINRDKLIKNLGYNLIVIWESDYKF